MAKQFNELPQSKTSRLIEFSDIEIRPGIINGSYFLVVSGTKPYANMDVKLMPFVYIQQPEYWGIEVVGCLAGFGLPTETQYTVSISLDGTRGTKGIEIIGATGSKKEEIE
jgi:hypothetical protein